MECNSVCLNIIFVSDIICMGIVCLIVLLFVVDNEKSLVNIIGKYCFNIICKILMGSCSKLFFIICVVVLYYYFKVKFFRCNFDF